MTAEITNRGSSDQKSINTQDRWERDFWTHKFGVTAEQLENAIAQVGNDPAKVEEYVHFHTGMRQPIG